MPDTNTAAQAFFNPSSPFGALTGWEDQTDNPTTSRQRAQALGADGDEIAAKTYDARTNVTGEYVATADSAAIPKAGEIKNGYHIDSIQVRYANNDFVKMTLQGHKHVGENVVSHAVNSCRTYTGSLQTIGTKFGCPDAPVGVSIPSGAGVRSVNYSLSCNHVDELGSQGDFLAGDNYDGSETVEVELCDTGNITAAQGWDLVNDGHTRGNTQAETSSATVEKHIAHDSAGSGS